MGLYLFEARSIEGKTLKGELQAESELEAKGKLRSQKLIPLTVALKGTEASTSYRSKKSIGVPKKLSYKEVKYFTRQLSALLESGVPLKESLESTIPVGVATPLGGVISVVLSNVQAGHSLSSSMAMFPKIFNRFYVSIVAVGEESGALVGVLNGLADYLDKAERLRSSLVRAMWYPGIIFFVVIGVVSMLLLFVIPNFVSVFGATGQELPFITLIFIKASDFFVSYWFVFLGFALGFFVLGKWFIRMPLGERIWHNLILHIPVIGDISRKGAVAQVSRVMHLLICSHVKLADALKLAGSGVSGNSVIDRVIMKSRGELMKGGSLSTVLRRSSILPMLMADMIHVGEETGNMSMMFEKLAEFFEDEAQRSIEVMVSLVEPIIIIFVGVLICVIVVAMYLPMFNMGDLGALDF